MMEESLKEISRFLLIADLSGYTAMTEAHGSLSAVQIVTKFIDIVKNSLTDKSSLVEQVGDEVFILSTDAESLIRSALNILWKAGKEINFLKVSIGIHYGELLEHEGHYFGSAINLTSRLAAYARGGQIICTETIQGKVKNIDELDFRNLGSVKFKNVKEPVEIYSIVSSSKPDVSYVLDPVCRMQVDLDDLVSQLIFKERTFYFCSQSCARKFLQDPDHYYNTAD